MDMVDMSLFGHTGVKHENGKVRKRSRARGFTILEALVAIVILGIGAIAVLSLQVSATKAGIDARYQTTALQLAGDLSAMMRSNPTVSTLSSSNPYLISTSSSPSTVAPGSGIGSRSSASDVANNDIVQWYARVYAVLPGARVEVCFDESPYNPSTGVPQWGCTHSGSIPYIKIGWSLSSGAAGLDQNVPGVVIPVGVCNAIDESAAAACYSAGI